MTGRKTWLVDFDETLASSNITWAFQKAFPKFIQAHRLNTDTERLASIMLLLQERASQDPDPDPLLHELFEHMDWPKDLMEPLLSDLFQNYQPAPFADTLRFLEQLQRQNERIYIVSNNPRTPKHANLLGLEPLVTRVITPKIDPELQPKPHRSMWDYIIANEADIDPQNAVVVGDDPWSDGLFAEACGLECWLIDRMNRFSDYYAQKPYFWVQSLAEVRI